MNIKLRLIYAAHMLLPLPFVCRSIERLDEATLQALRSLFGSAG